MPIDNRFLTPREVPLLLDYAPGAAAAYSLRKLSLSYTGPVVTVRRSSDNAEASFTAAQIDDGALLGWVGAGVSAYVKTWHDQSGNARNATQATAGYQPRIVDAGTLETEGGKAAVRFDGTDDRLETQSFATTSSQSAFAVAKASQWSPPSTNRVIVVHGFASGTTVGVAFFFLASSAAQDWLAGDIVAFGSGYASSRYPRAAGPINTGSDARVLSSLMGASVASIFVNGAVVSSRVSVPAAIPVISAPVTIGANNAALDRWLGTISEVIIYPSDMTAQRQRIEGDMAWYY